MPDAIVSKALIARQAEQAARIAVANPKAPPPPNPYCSLMEPALHMEWQASFTRQLHLQLNPEGEGSCA